ncbi:MAG: ZIP family metal transporter [Bacteroidota bacterium]
MELYQYIILFFSVMLSGSAYFLVKSSSRYFLKLSLAFSGSFLFAISILHLMPDIYSHNTGNIGVFVLLGFFIQIVLEFFSEGIEHGHIHVHHHPSKAFPLTMMVSLCLHSFLEGMPLAYDTHSNEGHNHSLFLGIALHHLPVAFALVSMLSDSGIKKTTALLWLALFALMAPLGSTLSYLLGEGILVDMTMYYDKIMAVVIGIFLHISTTILFESNNDHRFNMYKLGIIMIGGLFGYFIS